MSQQKLTPVVAIVGRANVGKSTLFNRLIEKRKAVTSSIAGTTRDLNFGHCHWRDQILTVIDTAGLDLTSEGATEEALKRQAEKAMTKADLILLVVDARDDVMPQDMALAKKLRGSKKPVLLIANKADNPRFRDKVANGGWLSLGMGAPMTISAANGSGVGDMLDAVLVPLKEAGITSRPLPEPDVRVALVGRPNVGKSSLLNALAGEERMIVSEVPHTTKEPQDTMLTFTDDEGLTRHMLLVDTVGIRKKARVEGGLERMGVSLSIIELARADVAFLLVDAAEGVGIQERKLAGLLERKNTAVLVVVNKWDLADSDTHGTGDQFRRQVARDLPFLKFAPIVFVSALTGNRVGKLPQYALDIMHQRNREIPQEELDAFVEKLKKQHHAIVGGGKDSNRPKVHGIRQIGKAPPTFMLVASKKETLHPNFLHFVENRMREEFGFAGTPIAVVSREIERRGK